MNALLIYHLCLGFTLLIIGLITIRFYRKKEGFQPGRWIAEQFVVVGVALTMVQWILTILLDGHLAFVACLALEILALIIIAIRAERMRVS